MMNETYLTFEGQRKKKTGKSRWTEIETSIPMSEIRKVALVDNSKTSPCYECEAYNKEEDYIDSEQCYYSNCYMAEEEKESFIEVEDDTYIYKLCQCLLLTDPKERDFLEKIFKLIKKGTKNIDVSMIREKIEQEEEKEREAERREDRRKEYNRKLKQKEKCGKCCCSQSDDKCLFGYKVIDGKPQEPCIKPRGKNYIDSDRKLIEEFRGE